MSRENDSPFLCFVESDWGGKGEVFEWDEFEYLGYVVVLGCGGVDNDLYGPSFDGTINKGVDVAVFE